MPSMLLELRVEMEDGATVDEVADQRDVAKREIQDFGCPMPQLDTRMHLAYRWLAWSAMTRRGLTALKWDEFDAQCVEVTDMPGPEDGDGLDPGQPAPPEKASSPSPTGQGNR